jgi:carbamoyl-phosphate synthase small subunit
MKNAALVLEDGTIITGNGFGCSKEVFGELVFNTSMTGYQEMFTDPSYAGQILLMTYPLIGNYGFNQKEHESSSVKIRGLVVKEPAFFTSRGKKITKYLREAGIPGIWGLDTRALTVKIRSRGSLKALLVMYSGRIDIRKLLARVRKAKHPHQCNLVEDVSCKKIIHHGRAGQKRIVLIDCGVKSSIIKEISNFGSIIQVPYDTSHEKIKRFRPAGIIISNGPGDPGHPRLKNTIRTIKCLLGTCPIFGICLGHQLVGLAFGLRTFKLKFGHRGSNHPVKDLATGKVHITSQNHGYAVEPDPRTAGLRFDWINLNDGTNEGMSHAGLGVFSVQFHPEAAPGTRDTSFLLRKFSEMINAKAH